MSKTIIVDTNILFSILLSGSSRLSKVLLDSPYHFSTCELAYVELFALKEKIIKSSQLTNEQMIELLHFCLRKITFFKEDNISKKNLERAYQLCREIDKDDTFFVALTLELDGLLWTGDKKLVAGLKKLGFDRFFEVGNSSILPTVTI
jgi:predicted nucleic acid-binding protein